MKFYCFYIDIIPKMISERAALIGEKDYCEYLLIYLAKHNYYCKNIPD